MRNQNLMKSVSGKSEDKLDLKKECIVVELEIL